MPDPDALIPVGKIIGPHGIRGLLKFHSYSGGMSSVCVGSRVTLKGSDGSIAVFEVTGISPHGEKFLISLSDSTTMNSAESLAGYELCLWRSQLPDPEPDEYYWCDLIGLSVYTVQGERLGVLTEIFETGSNDVYVVQKDETKEFLIPAIEEVVREVDLAGGKLVISPLEGLLDL